MEPDYFIKNLNKNFRLDAYEPPSTKESIEELKAVSHISIPEDYINLLNSVSEAEILMQDGRYIRIWGAKRSIEMNEAYEIQKYISNSLAIGDDEGGMVLILMTGNFGFGLYKVGFGDLDPKEAEFIASSLNNLLIQGVTPTSVSSQHR